MSEKPCEMCTKSSVDSWICGRAWHQGISLYRYS